MNCFLLNCSSGRAFFRDPGSAQAVNIALPLGDRSRMVARSIGAKSGDGESRDDRQSGLSLGPRLRELPEPRKSGSQQETRAGEAPIGFDGAAQPGHRLLLAAEVKFSQPGEQTARAGDMNARD